MIDTLASIDTEEAAGISVPVGTIGVRTEDVSAIPGNLGYNVFADWVLSVEITGANTPDTAWKAGVPSAPGPIGTPVVSPNVDPD